MMDRFFSMVKNITDVLNIFDSFQQGSVVLQAGNHGVEVITRKTPVDIWVSLKNSGDMPVCNGDIDKISYRLTKDGFILYADVVSEVIQVEWYAEFNVDEE